MKVRGDGELGHKRCVHCVGLPWMVILIIERVRCHILLANRIGIGHVASIMGALVAAVMCPWFFYSLRWHRWTSHFKLWLVASIFHHAALDLLHLWQIRGSFHFGVQVVTTSHLRYLALIVVSWNSCAGLNLRQELVCPFKSPELLSTPQP